MTRFWMGLAIAITLVVGPLQPQNLAAQADKAPVAKQAKTSFKTCRAKGDGGKAVTWLCKAEQPCCYNSFLNKGVCGSTVIGCF